jgi:hypothetical protein
LYGNVADKPQACRNAAERFGEAGGLL